MLYIGVIAIRHSFQLEFVKKIDKRQDFVERNKRVDMRPADANEAEAPGDVI